MRTLRAITTLAEYEKLQLQVGPLVALASASALLGVNRARVYQLAEAGTLPVYAVFGVYYTSLSMLKERRGARLVV